MGFGIEIFGKDGGGEFLVTDTDQNLENYQVTASGTASSVNVGSGGKPLLFFNGNVFGTEGNPVVAYRSGSTVYFERVTYSVAGGGQIYNTAVTSTNVNYILLQQMTAISNSGGNYGIQLFKSGGGVAFDSRRITTNTSFVVTASQAPRSVQGNPTSSGSVISTNENLYLEYSFTYKLILTGLGGFEDTVSAARFGGSTNDIRHVSYFTDYRTSGGGSGGTNYLSNHQAMIIGQNR